MSDENNNNNETPNSKINNSPNDKDNTTNTNNDKNISNLNSSKRNSKNNLVGTLLSLDRKSSSKTILDDTKLLTNLLETQTIKNETTSKDLLKKTDRKKSMRRKRKKGKKGKILEKHESESILLTEVKHIPEKKKEETENHKYLRQKLENLNFSKNLQTAIDSGFEKTNEIIKDDLIGNYNINEKKKLNIEELIKNKNVKLNLNID